MGVITKWDYIFIFFRGGGSFLYILGLLFKKSRYRMGIFFGPRNTPIPHRPRIPRIDKYLDSWLNRTQFVKILIDSRSP